MCVDCLDDELLEEARSKFEKKPQNPKNFIYACKLSEIPPNGNRGKVIIVDTEEIALFLLNGIVYAISNICPHEHSPLLAEGYVNREALTVECPLHGWTYKIPTGESIVGGSRIASYAVKVIHDEVWVEEPLCDLKKDNPF